MDIFEKTILGKMGVLGMRWGEHKTPEEASLKETSDLIKSHATPVKNIESIKKNGIKRPANLLASDPSYPVYFADTEEVVHAAGKYWALENGKASTYAVIRFKIPKEAEKKIGAHPQHKHAFELHCDVSPLWITAIDIYDKDGKFLTSKIKQDEKEFFLLVPIIREE
jgi:hypothetical protein